MSGNAKVTCESCGESFFPIFSGSTLCYKCYKRVKEVKPDNVKKLTKKVVLGINEIQAESQPLTNEEKNTVCLLLARFTDIADIQRYFTKEGKEVESRCIRSIRDSKKWKPVIEWYRKDWITKIQDVPIANKRYRIEGWQTMYEEAVKVKKLSVMKSALIGARDEMEGIVVQGKGNNYSLTYIANMTDNDLLKRRGEIMEKIKLVSRTLPKFNGESTDQIEEGVYSDSKTEEIGFT